MVGSIPHRRPLPPRAREGVPLRVRPQATERTGEYPRSSYPAPPARGPPSRCRGEGITPGTTPHQTPLWPRRREGAPQPRPTAPVFNPSYPAPPARGPPSRCWGQGGTLRSTPPSKAPSAPSPGRCAPSSPLPAHFESDGQAPQQTGEYPRSSYPAPPARAPPSGCRGEEGTPGSTPHGKPLRPRPTEGAPLRAPLRPTAPWPTSSPTAKPPSELASTENHPIRPLLPGPPPTRAPPSSCRGRRGTPRSTPHRRPPPRRRREGAPLGQAHRPPGWKSSYPAHGL